MLAKKCALIAFTLLCAGVSSRAQDNPPFKYLEDIPTGSSIRVGVSSPKPTPKANILDSPDGTPRRKRGSTRAWESLWTSRDMLGHRTWNWRPNIHAITATLLAHNTTSAGWAISICSLTGLWASWHVYEK